MGREKRVDWICPKCDSKNRASWGDVSGEIVCRKCGAVSMWQDVLSRVEIMALINEVKKIT